MVLLLSFALYLPSVRNGFAMDDTPIASSEWNRRPGQPDPMIAGSREESTTDWLKKFFFRHYWWPETDNDGLYRPISVLSYGLTYHLLGKHFANEGAPQHFLNVLIHTWAVWLVIQLLLQLRAGRFASLLVGLMFGVHAIHSEVVAGIIGRAEMFSFCFGAQALLLTLSGSAWWRWGLAGLLLFCAYGSKESSVCWVPFFFCCQLARQWRIDPGGDSWAPFRIPQVLKTAIVLLVPLAVYFWLRADAFSMDVRLDEPPDFSSNPLAHLEYGVRIMTAVKVWGYGLLICLAPYQLSCLYSPFVFEHVQSPLDVGFLAALVALGGFLFVGSWNARRQPLLFVAMTCFLGFSFVTSNVPIVIGTVLGERLYYTPSLGICILPALALPYLKGVAAKVFLGCIALWCAGNIVMAEYRTILWHSSTMVFAHDQEAFPKAIDLHRKCAACYASDGPDKDMDKAIWHLNEAKRLLPIYSHAYRDLGNIYVRQEKWKEAIAELKQAFGRGYKEPAGSESLAFNKLGDCYIRLAREAKDPKEKRRLNLEALVWWERTLGLQAWGDSHQSAYKKIFSESVGVLSPRKLRELFDDAMRLYIEQGPVQGDHTMALVAGSVAARVGAPVFGPQDVLGSLGNAIALYPENEKDLNYLKAHLFLAAALVRTNRIQEARARYEKVLRHEDFPEDLKVQVRDELQKPMFRRGF